MTSTRKGKAAAAFAATAAAAAKAEGGSSFHGSPLPSPPLPSPPAVPLSPLRPYSMRKRPTPCPATPHAKTPAAKKSTADLRSPAATAEVAQPRTPAARGKESVAAAAAEELLAGTGAPSTDDPFDDLSSPPRPATLPSPSHPIEVLSRDALGEALSHLPLSDMCGPAALACRSFCDALRESGASKKNLLSFFRFFFFSCFFFCCF